MPLTYRACTACGRALVQGLDFRPHVLERTRDFTGRQWVFQAVDNWLASPDGPRFFLLSGEPGSGKTAVAARLWQLARGTIAPSTGGLVHLTPGFLSAVHFCAAHDHRWIEPLEFVGALATPWRR